MKRSLSAITITNLFLLIFLLTGNLFAGNFPQYQEKESINLNWSNSSSKAYFDGVNYDVEHHNTPYFSKQFPIISKDIQYLVDVVPTSWEVINNNLSEGILNQLKDNEEVNFTYSLSQAMGQGKINFRLIPYIRLEDPSKIKRISSFEVIISASSSEINNALLSTNNEDLKTTYPDHSVLADGDIYKIAVSETGMYKISGKDLNDLGINLSGLNPKNIKMYCLRGGLLPEDEKVERYNQLQELPIYVSNNSSFSENDYITFYGESPNSWERLSVSNKYFTPKYHYSSDYTYYFIKISPEEGKRIQSLKPTSDAANFSTDVFLDYKVYEDPKKNIIKGGRHFFGYEMSKVSPNKDFDFDFANRATDSTFYVQGIYAATNSSSSRIKVNVNGNQAGTVSIDPTKPDNMKTTKALYSVKSSSNNINVNLNSTLSSSGSSAYVKYIAVNAYRKLVFSGAQVVFRNIVNIGENKITKYNIQSSSSPIIWNVSNPFEAFQVDYNKSGNNISFSTPTEELQTFSMFNSDDLKSVKLIGKEKNQDLHSIRNIDYIILVYPDFISQAERLAQLHRANGLKVNVVTTEQVYNEFSSGAEDISAIRDFVRMVYMGSDDGKQLKYLLLFGDASYDVKGRLGVQSNYVPAWESDALEELEITKSVVTDDFYGLLDRGINETSLHGMLDIGIGRFPVENIHEATVAVDKVERYMSRKDDVLGPWKNQITFVADAGDGNLHLSDANYIANLVEENHPVYNQRKIYLGANERITTPNGVRSPATNQAINQAIENGTLIMNYNGHGGEIGWSEKRILEINDINSWTNKNKLPLFITATCEFCRYDDPERRSAGEKVFLSEKGGAIALFTTARVTYSGSNKRLNAAVIDTLLSSAGKSDLGLGYILSIGKNAVIGSSFYNFRVFALMGDPALCLTHTNKEAVTTELNDKDITLQLDTIKALSKIKLNGQIRNKDGSIDNSFNGEIFVKIFDKPTNYATKGIETPVYPFKAQTSLLYNGRNAVINGEFSCTFVVPKDINYSFGEGKISLYAKADSKDASGYFNKIKVGGFNNDANLESDGPVVDLFLNDETFKDGGITDENPILLAKIFDENGINATGSGIGHQITAIIDDNLDNPYFLDSYYQTELNSYQKGSVSYPFKNIEPGPHKLSFKVWDVLNNSTTKEIHFVVEPRSTVKMENVYNYPNPVNGTTRFFFNHNQAGEELEVTINIYDITGKMVQELQTNFISTGYSTPIIDWNPKNNNGSLLKNGVYPYQVHVKNKATNETSVSESKLVLIK